MKAGKRKGKPEIFGFKVLFQINSGPTVTQCILMHFYFYKYKSALHFNAVYFFLIYRT